MPKKHRKFIRQWKRRQKTIKRELARLLKMGLIAEVEPGKFALTEAGKAYVETLENSNQKELAQ